jgi:hypothetical protein
LRPSYSAGGTALHAARAIRDRASKPHPQTRPDDRASGYLADAITEDLELGKSPEPLDLGHEQIEALVDILFGARPDEPLQRLRQACQRC